MELISRSAEMTASMGLLIGHDCAAGDIIGLGGDLGAGKTALARAIAAGAGVDRDEYVASPTFAIMHEYRGRVPVYHMDFYRLASSLEVRELGLDEYLFGAGLCLIEWFERAQDLLPPSSLIIDLAIIDECVRRLTLSSGAPKWQATLARIEASAISG